MEVPTSSNECWLNTFRGVDDVSHSLTSAHWRVVEAAGVILNIEKRRGIIQHEQQWLKYHHSVCKCHPCSFRGSDCLQTRMSIDLMRINTGNAFGDQIVVDLSNTLKYPHRNEIWFWLTYDTNSLGRASQNRKSISKMITVSVGNEDVIRFQPFILSNLGFLRRKET